LFPTRLREVPGYDLAGHHEASGQLGGEYYDVLQMPGGRYGLLVGSASGSGVPAAMVMAMARSFLAALARSETDPGKVLREVNALLSGDLRRGMYVTVLLAVLDPGAGTLTLANAGHAPLLYCKAGGKSVAPVQSEGIALGFDKGPVFDQTLKVVRLTLKSGDRAVLFTPGVTRVTGADGSALGEGRFAAVVKREAHQPAATFVRRVAATVKKFRGDLPLSEDVTLLTLGRLSEEST
jgi:sigma-B regulation protein RsbU (phosphoserine phosphatase)